MEEGARFSALPPLPIASLRSAPPGGLPPIVPVALHYESWAREACVAGPLGGECCGLGEIRIRYPYHHGYVSMTLTRRNRLRIAYERRIGVPYVTIPYGMVQYRYGSRLAWRHACMYGTNTDTEPYGTVQYRAVSYGNHFRTLCSEPNGTVRYGTVEYRTVRYQMA